MENLPRDPRVDKPLKITNDARKAGLNFRLIDPEAAMAVARNDAVQRGFEGAKVQPVKIKDMETPTVEPEGQKTEREFSRMRMR